MTFFQVVMKPKYSIYSNQHWEHLLSLAQVVTHYSCCNNSPRPSSGWKHFLKCVYTYSIWLQCLVSFSSLRWRFSECVGQLDSMNLISHCTSSFPVLLWDCWLWRHIVFWLPWGYAGTDSSLWLQTYHVQMSPSELRIQAPLKNSEEETSSMP